MTVTEAIKQIEKITGIADSTTGAGEAWRVIKDKLSENYEGENEGVIRVIKFRGWDKKRQRWLHESDVYEEVIEQARWNPSRREQFELEQFTGLKDSKGVDIYEGDIVQWNGYETQNGKQIRPQRQRAVGMTTDPFRITFIDDCYHIQNLLENGEYVEVIGNIHEKHINEVRKE